MQYSQLVAPRRSIIVNEATPEPGRGEVLVEVKACGVCASELHPWMDKRGSYPHRIGHEPAGIVKAVGPDVSRCKPGDRVTGLFQPAYSDYAVAGEDDVLLVPERASPWMSPLASRRHVWSTLSGARTWSLPTESR